MLEKYVTYTQELTLGELLKITELDLPTYNGFVRSCDWLERLTPIAFGWDIRLNNRKAQWLIKFAVELSDGLISNGKNLQRVAGFEKKERIYRYNETARKLTLAIAMLIRLELDDQLLTKKNIDRIKKVVTDDAVISLFNGGKVNLSYRLPASTSKDVFCDKSAATYKEAVTYVSWKTGRKPSQSFIYKHFPQAKKRLFTRQDCEFLVSRLDFQREVC